jgi:sugar lactone lactonase YvrE
VVRYAPDGSISGGIVVPATQVTCVAFGGRDLDLLFVTSARQDLSAPQLARELNAGDLFIYQLNVKGLADARFVPTHRAGTRRSG